MQDQCSNKKKSLKRKISLSAELICFKQQLINAVTVKRNFTDKGAYTSLFKGLRS